MSNLEENRPWSNDLKEKIKNADTKNILDYYEKLSLKWSIVKNDNIIKEACNRFEISDLNNIDTSVLQIGLDKAIFEATVVFSKFKSINGTQRTRKCFNARIFFGY
jgi:hypothetical protein